MASPRRARPGDGRRQGLWPAQRPRAGAVLVQQDPAGLSSATPPRPPGKSTRRWATSSPPSIRAISSAAIGDAFQGPYIYYWSGRGADLPGRGRDLQVRTPPTPNAVKVSNLIDHMVANKTLTLDSVFGAQFVASAANLVAIPGPAWYCGRAVPEPGWRQRHGRRLGRGSAAEMGRRRCRHRQRGWRRLVRLEPHAEPRGGEDLPASSSSPTTRPPAPAACRPTRRRPTSLARHAGGERLLCRRLQGGDPGGRLERLERLGLSQLLARNLVGQDRHPRPRGGQDHDRPRGRLAAGNEERSAGRRLHRRVTLSLRCRGRGAPSAAVIERINLDVIPAKAGLGGALPSSVTAALRATSLLRLRSG